MTRSEFLCSLLGLAGVATGVTACGADDDSGDGGDACASVDATIGSPSHGSPHTLTIPVEDVLGGDSQTYELTTGDGHTHLVTINAPNMTKLANGESIQTQSTTDAGHEHPVTVTC